MASIFAWIDDSDEQRDRIQDAIDLFRVRSTRDELGVSVIRDAFSDLLFPGTGSLQTRAAYFLFVPWMYRALEEENVRSAEIKERAKRRELDMIAVLQVSDDSRGAIGSRAGRLLRRLPSSIYWSGLGRLRVRRLEATQDAYHRSLDGWYKRQQTAIATDDRDSSSAPQPNWHSSIPAPPRDWPNKATLRLRPIDASYLRERIRSEAGTSLFARMDGRVVDGERTPFPWDHRVAAEIERDDDQVSKSLSRQLHHARCFSEAMHGAAVLYNLAIAELIPGGHDQVSKYSQMMAEWHSLIASRASALAEWDLLDLWRLMTEAKARIHPNTQFFVTSWVELVRRQDFRNATSSDHARALIDRREQSLKGPLARIHNAGARNNWQGDSGLGRLEYRWDTAQAILEDIAAGLAGGSHA
jgi:hypothetical protein